MEVAVLEYPDCPVCGAALGPEHHDRVAATLTCPSCGAVFDVDVEPAEAPASSPEPPPVPMETTTEPPPPASPATRSEPRVGVPAPATERPDVPAREVRPLVLTRRWYSGAAWGLVVMAVFWNGFMLLWYGIAFAEGEWAMALFGLLHLLVGVFLAYAAAGALFNETTIRIGGGRVKVEHGPIPWAGQHDLPASDLDQLWVVERRRNTKNGVHITYDVRAELGDGGELVFLKGLDAAEDAREIERQVERALGILDRPMPDEHVG